MKFKVLNTLINIPQIDASSLSAKLVSSLLFNTLFFYLYWIKIKYFR